MAQKKASLFCPLLLEVGVEEIPARFLAAAEKSLGERLTAALTELCLLPEGAPAIETYSTPRRLVARARQVLARQADRVQEVTGPPVKVAYDAAGKPTRAAESFAEKNQAKLEALTRITTPKGEYLAVNKTTRGRSAQELLAEAFTGVITGIPFQKSMYWTAKSSPRFARPIRWLLALLGEGKASKVVPFEIAGVRSGSSTFGHRSTGGRPIRISSFEDYLGKLREQSVEVDPTLRRQAIQNQIKVLLEQSNFLSVPDLNLEDWLVNSTEWPHAILGSFDRKFLELPREILITVMRDHQKYFAVEDREGNLQQSFVTVLNVEGDPKGIIRAGHERVLKARFTDAQFFWDADQKISLRDRLPMLAKVTFQAQLGTYADKVRRMEAIVNELCSTLEKQGKMTALDTAQALRAVQLCKCDLTTQMVQEFPELQGVVGGLYAKARDVPTAVADAIYDHYKPLNVEDDCPRSLVSTIVSLADKLDSVVGGFLAGFEPTGSSDPFGLRRQGNSVVKLLLRYEIELDLEQSLIRTAGYSGFPKVEERTVEETIGVAFVFLKERLRYYLGYCEGIGPSVVRAALGGEWNKIVIVPRVRARAIGLQGVLASEDFAAVCAAAKRVRNILAQAASNGLQQASVNLGWFAEDTERRLYEECRNTSQTVNNLDAQGDYRGAFEAMAKLRPHVDAFFDGVLVMSDDHHLRQNRLGILDELNRLFSSIADLSEIESAALTSVGAPTSKAGAVE